MNNDRRHDEINLMKIDMQDMKNDIANIKEDVAEIKKDLKEFILESDKRFAGKWVERVLVGVATTIGLAIIGALMALLLK